MALVLVLLAGTAAAGPKHWLRLSHFVGLPDLVGLPRAEFHSVFLDRCKGGGYATPVGSWRGAHCEDPSGGRRRCRQSPRELLCDCAPGARIVVNRPGAQVGLVIPPEYIGSDQGPATASGRYRLGDAVEVCLDLSELQADQTWLLDAKPAGTTEALLVTSVLRHPVVPDEDLCLQLPDGAAIDLVARADYTLTAALHVDGPGTVTPHFH